MRVRVLRAHLDGDQVMRRRNEEFDIDERAAVGKIRDGILEHVDGKPRHAPEKAVRKGAPELAMGHGGGKATAKGKKPKGESSSSGLAEKLDDGAV